MFYAAKDYISAILHNTDYAELFISVALTFFSVNYRYLDAIGKID